MATFYIYLCFLFFSFLVSVANYRWLKSRLMHGFPYLLLLTLIVELLANYLNRERGIQNAFMYNLFVPIEIGYFAWFYLRLPVNRSQRIFLGTLLGIYFAANLVMYLFIRPLTRFNAYLFIAGGLMIVIICLLFFYNYFNLDNPREETRWQPVIWISAGIVAYFTVACSTLALYNFMVSLQAELFGVRLYRLIPQILSIFMYSSFAYAFVLCRKEKLIS
jgi:hypothetical protein